MNANVGSIRTNQKSGFLLFYVMGVVALLILFGLVSAGSAAMEARSAKNKLLEAQAISHAEAGIELVKSKVEAGLIAGQSLPAILGGLSVTAPAGIEFDPISDFTILVPDRIFQFNSVGRSGDAEVSLFVQLRRKELFQAGVFGSDNVSTQPGVSIYGYDSRDGVAPSAATSNGKGSVGSNYELEFGGNLILDGVVILGADANGTTATCSGCVGLETFETDYVETDPLGVNGGVMAAEFLKAQLSNNNAAISDINSATGALTTKPNTSVTFTAGDYYLTSIYTAPNTTIIIDASAGPVRFFVTGEVYFAPSNGLPLNDPFDFQIYSNSTEDFRIQPNGDLSIFAYAPNTDVELWPNGRMSGAFWGRTVNMQPGGNFFVDSSLQDRWLRNDLTIHARFKIKSK